MQRSSSAVTVHSGLLGVGALSLLMLGSPAYSFPVNHPTNCSSCHGARPLLSTTSSGSSTITFGNNGNTLVGTTTSATWTLKNNHVNSGTGPLNRGGGFTGSFPAASGEFGPTSTRAINGTVSDGGSAPEYLIPQQSDTRTYTYTPAQRSNGVFDSITLTFTPTNGGSNPSSASVTLRGKGVAPQISLSSSAAASAGNILVGQSGTSSLTATNVGDGGLASSSLGTARNLNGSFAAGSGVFSGGATGFSLVDDASQTKNYTFTPTSRNNFSLIVNVNTTNGSTNGQNDPQTLTRTLSGKGVAPQISLNTTQTDAGIVLVGNSGTSRVTVNNVGDGNQASAALGTLRNLNGSFAAGSGVFGGAMSTFSIVDGGSVNKDYTFTPTSRNNFSLGVNVVTDNGSNNGLNQAQTLGATLTGKGVAPLANLITTGANAGNVLVGMSGGLSIQMRNDGDGNTSGAGDASNLKGNFGSGAGPFSGVGTGFNLADGASQTQNYSFTPLSRGTFNAPADVNTTNGSSNGQNQAQTLAATLLGKGVAPVASLDASQANAGNVRIGTIGQARVGVQNVGDGNQSGLGALSNLKGNFASGTGPFSGAGAAFDLGDGTSQLQQYDFSPSTRGVANLDVNVVTSNGSSDGTNLGQTHAAQIAGTGVGPMFASSVAPGSTIDFGTVFLSTPGTLPLNLSNNSPDPDGLGDLTALTLKSFSITGEDKDLFAVMNFVEGMKLADGASLPLEVRFLGSTVKDTYTANLSFLTDELAALGGDGSAFNYSLQAVAVPEPKTWFLFAAGLACVGMMAMRRRRESLRVQS